MAASLWVKILVNHRIAGQTTVPCSREDPREALLKACHDLDLPEPVWLEKNQREWEEFGMTRFLPDAFLRRSPFSGWKSNTSIRKRRKRGAGITGTSSERRTVRRRRKEAQEENGT